MKTKLIGISLLIVIFSACCREDDDPPRVKVEPSPVEYNPTPYSLQLPSHFDLLPAPFIPEDNPLTVEGIELGKKLFYEKKLSKNNLMSCGSCHKPQFAFNDKGNPLSIGVDGLPGVRNAMPLFNLAWVPVQNSSFNWHGSAESLEDQAIEPVINPLEMAETWSNVVQKLQSDSEYPNLFFSAFGTKTIDSNLVVKAIAQFERTLISGNSRADNFIRVFKGDPVQGPSLTDQEIRGFNIYMDEGKGDCFHCHGDLSNPLFTDNNFFNNGLDANPDSGLALVTKNPNDIGKFRTPSLRNLLFTAPYMHDGRFETLEEVVDFYTSGVNANSPNLDVNMDPIQKPRNLNPQEKRDLVAFLKALTDSSFVQNPAYLPNP